MLAWLIFGIIGAVLAAIGLVMTIVWRLASDVTAGGRTPDHPPRG
ncbi:hypothetical protein ACXPWS_19720 [Mycobacterium sp. BMJ-28]